MKHFEGEYVRGGRQTLYMTRQDVVETLALIQRKGFDLRVMMKEAHELNAYNSLVSHAFQQKMGDLYK